MKTELNETVARRVLEVVDAGLVQGMGKQVAGAMCVEAAVCFALGLPHSDEPPCVGAAVRRYKIRVNDAYWSSDQARAKGMRRVAIAQLGSNLIDQRAFADYVVIEGVKRILPIALNAALKHAPEERKAPLLAAIAACEAAASITDARQAASLSKSATRYAYAYADAAAYAAYAYAYAAYAADAYADAAAYAAYAADAYADAAAYAAYAYADAARDKVLSLAAEIAVEALQKLGSQGCQWLFLCDEVK